jgi:Ser/Thr protein kinase RdoA (MazF antagonist)
MHREIAALFNDDILAEAAWRYGVDAGALSELEGFENFIYQYQRGGADYILRLSQSLRRSADYIRGEMEWIDFLADGGIPAAQPIPSQRDNPLEVIPCDSGGSYFVAAAFERVPGVILDDDPQAKATYWNETLFENWGRLMGQMHSRSKEYTVSDPAFKRQEWHQYDVLALARFIPAEQDLVLERGNALIDKLKALPRDRDSYGLIHADLTQWNFCVHEGELAVFDFDSCEYCWFAKDIAVALYYAPASDEGDDRQAFAGGFLRSFLRGYLGENPLDPSWLRLIPDFLTLQKLLLYSYCYQLGDLVELEKEQPGYLEDARRTIEMDLPVVDLDFEKIINDVTQVV